MEARYIDTRVATTNHTREVEERRRNSESTMEGILYVLGYAFHEIWQQARHLRLHCKRVEHSRIRDRDSSLFPYYAPSVQSRSSNL